MLVVLSFSTYGGVLLLTCSCSRTQLDTLAAHKSVGPESNSILCKPNNGLCSALPTSHEDMATERKKHERNSNESVYGPMTSYHHKWIWMVGML